MSAPQGSPEWFAARCGKVTASKFADAMAKGKGITRDKYLSQVVVERLTGKPCIGYQNAATDRGHEQEAAARRAFERITGHIVEEVGFVAHPRMPEVGASPDGLIDDDGGCEIKCVEPHIQIATLLRGAMPPEHAAQVQGNMWVCERIWWKLCSYCPDMPEHLQVVIYRVGRDDDYIANLSAEVARFCKDAAMLQAALTEMKEAA